MNKRNKVILSIIGDHFLGIIITFALLLVAGAVFGENNLWIFSIVTGVIYMTSLYSRGWKNSGKDYRLVNASVSQDEAEGMTYKRHRGFIDALALVALGIVMLAVGQFAGKIGLAIYRLYNFAFVFLFDKVKTPFVMEILVIILPYLAYALGYVAGKNKKTFISQHIGKLIYKSKKNNERARR